MKKIIDFLVDKRVWAFAVMLVLTIVGAVLIAFVDINDDMTKYLPNNSSMKQGLEIMQEQFPDEESGAQSFKIMFSGLSDDDKDAVLAELEGYEHITSVQYDKDSTAHNNGDYTLYVVNTDFESADKTDDFIENLQGDFKSYETNTYYENSAESSLSVMNIILPIAIILVVAIMLLLCNSLFEPVLIIATIGIAIIINMGTNIIIPDVSDITFSIAAIMQLILSIDYSVILFNRYSQEKALLPNNKIEAMKNTLKHSMGSILGSSITTFAGLLAILFMSFTIGINMGLVLAKGVLFSLICVFTVLPALILWSDKLLDKTNKHRLAEKIRQRKFAKREAKERNV